MPPAVITTPINVFPSPNTSDTKSITPSRAPGIEAILQWQHPGAPSFQTHAAAYRSIKVAPVVSVRQVSVLRSAGMAASPDPQFFG